MGLTPCKTASEKAWLTFSGYELLIELRRIGATINDRQAAAMEATRHRMGADARQSKAAGPCRWLGGVLALMVLLAGVQFLVASPALAGGTVTATEYKMAGDATKMRIVLNFDGEPEPRWFLLRWSSICLPPK